MRWRVRWRVRVRVRIHPTLLLAASEGQRSRKDVPGPIYDAPAHPGRASTAAENVERFEKRMHAMAGTAFPRRMGLFLALVSLHMEELASPEAENLIGEAMETSRNKSSVCSSNEYTMV